MKENRIWESIPWATEYDGSIALCIEIADAEKAVAELPRVLRLRGCGSPILRDPQSGYVFECVFFWAEIKRSLRANVGDEIADELIADYESEA